MNAYIFKTYFSAILLRFKDNKETEAWLKIVNYQTAKEYQ